MLLLLPLLLPTASGDATTTTTTTTSTLSSLVRLTHRDAICLDGNPGGYYIRRSQSTSSKKWALHHEGGGWCQMEQPYESWPNNNCIARANTTLGTLERDPKTKDWTSTLGCATCSPNATINPTTHDWNHVYIRYCDGGTFGGTLREPFVSKNADHHTVHFQGKHILEDVVASLSSRYGNDFIQGTEFVIGGSSAGGLAVYLHLDWWRSKLPSTAVVVGLADSGFFEDWKLNTTSSHSYDSDLRWGFDNMNLSVNEDCTRRAKEEGKEERKEEGKEKGTEEGKEERKEKGKEKGKLASDCVFARNVLPHIETPIFMLQSIFDSWQLQWEHGITKIPNFAALNAYGQQLKSSMMLALKEKKKETVIGGFVEQCFHHCTTEELWTETPRINTLTPQQAFDQWYNAVKAGTIAAEVLWQKSGSLPCENCNCPAGMVGPKSGPHPKAAP